MIEEGRIQGTVHCHSQHSFDAQMSYAELREFFVSHGLKFVCITEHIEYLDQAAVNEIIDDCRANSDDDFVFVPGIEMDYFKIYFLGVEKTQIDFSTHRSTFDSIRPKARLCIFSHPIKARYKYPQWLMDLCDGVEILNTKHDGRHYFRPQSERLLEKVRRQRPSAIGVAGMDFHSIKQYSGTHLVLRDNVPITEDSILNALGSGNFDVYMKGRNLAHVPSVEKAFLRTKIHMMDFAHGINKRIAGAGLKLPKGLKRLLRKGMEGA